MHDLFFSLAGTCAINAGGTDLLIHQQGFA